MAYEFTTEFINPEGLKQSINWFDRTGREYEIKNMSKQHCRGAMKKLFTAFGGRACHTPLYRALQSQYSKPQTL